MRVAALAFALAVLSCGAVDAQFLPVDTAPPPVQLPVPKVTINDHAIAFQASLYPEFYKTNSVRRDILWVQDNDSVLTAFWQAKGDSILWLLSQYSGLEWEEGGFEIFALRFYPSMGGPEPLALPLGGLRRSQLTLAAPEGSVLQLDLVYQLARRMLLQAELSSDPFVRGVASHPLMQPTPYRQDNLALLLTLVTAQQVMGADSTLQAYQSAFFKQRTPGRRILEDYLLSQWILTPDRPLVQYIAEEPYNADLVNMTRPPRRPASGSAERPREYIEGLPLKGELGFSVKADEGGRLVVDKIDVTRLAYACGLREGDLVRSVDGKRARNQKEMVESILAGLDQGGATVSIQRDGQHQTVLIQPMAMAGDEDDYMLWENLPDSTGQEQYRPPGDTTAVDTLRVAPH
jgi:hypothetical protein